MAIELGQRPAPQGPERQHPPIGTVVRRQLNVLTKGYWDHEKRIVRYATRAGVGALAAVPVAIGAFAAVGGFESIAIDPQVGGTTPVDPNPAYTGPDANCWTVYDHAVAQANIPDGSITPAEAQTLVDCTTENPGYFGQQTVPVSDGSSAVIGDRPLK